MKHLEDINFADESFPIKIITYRSSFINKLDTAASAFHEAVEIKYFYEGESTMIIGSETVHAKVGDVIVINPYEFHTTVDYGKSEQGKYHLFMIGLDFFEGARCSNVNLRRHLLENRVTLKTKISDNDVIKGILDRIVQKYTECGNYSNLAIYGLVAELFAELLNNTTGANTEIQTKDTLSYYAMIEPALRMIRDGYSGRFDVEELADACRISKFHFCRIFKTVMGMSAIHYLNYHRLKIADTLLKNTDRAVGEIAAMCGFDDASYFSRIYKKHFGLTPKQAKETNYEQGQKDLA